MYNFSKKISMNFRKIHDVFLKLPVILSELLQGYISKTILAKQEAISTPESQVNVNDNIH